MNHTKNFPFVKEKFKATVDYSLSEKQPAWFRGQAPELDRRIPKLCQCHLHDNAMLGKLPNLHTLLSSFE